MGVFMKPFISRKRLRGIVALMHTNHRNLYRSTKNRVFAGICGGLGDYFDIDPVPIRLVWLLTVIFTGVFPGVVACVLAIFIVPLPPEGSA